MKEVFWERLTGVQVRNMVAASSMRFAMKIRPPGRRKTGGKRADQTAGIGAARRHDSLSPDPVRYNWRMIKNLLSIQMISVASAPGLPPLSPPAIAPIGPSPDGRHLAACAEVKGLLGLSGLPRIAIPAFKLETGHNQPAFGLAEA